MGDKKAEGDDFTGTAEIVPKNPRGDVAEEESDMSTRVMSGLSLSRIPTSKPYVSIEDAEAAIILHEKALAMTARNSASDPVNRLVYERDSKPSAGAVEELQLKQSRMAGEKKVFHVHDARARFQESNLLPV